MAFVTYTLAALALVLGVAWALYVAPTPGPSSPAMLAVALVPSLSILVLGGMLMGAALVLRAVIRRVRRRS